MGVKISYLLKVTYEVILTILRCFSEDSWQKGLVETLVDLRETSWDFCDFSWLWWDFSESLTYECSFCSLKRSPIHTVQSESLKHQFLDIFARCGATISLIVVGGVGGVFL